METDVEITDADDVETVDTDDVEITDTDGNPVDPADSIIVMHFTPTSLRAGLEAVNLSYTLEDGTPLVVEGAPYHARTDYPAWLETVNFALAKVGLALGNPLVNEAAYRRACESAERAGLAKPASSLYQDSWTLHPLH